VKSKYNMKRQMIRNHDWQGCCKVERDTIFDLNTEHKFYFMGISSVSCKCRDRELPTTQGKTNKWTTAYNQTCQAAC
jgi:hypothetical protein